MYEYSNRIAFCGSLLTRELLKHRHKRPHDIGNPFIFCHCSNCKENNIFITEAKF